MTGQGEPTAAKRPAKSLLWLRLPLAAALIFNALLLVRIPLASSAAGDGATESPAATSSIDDLAGAQSAETAAAVAPQVDEVDPLPEAGILPAATVSIGFPDDDGQAAPQSVAASSPSVAQFSELQSRQLSAVGEWFARSAQTSTREAFTWTRHGRQRLVRLADAAPARSEATPASPPRRVETPTLAAPSVPSALLLTLANARENGVDVSFLVDDTVFTLKPGERRRFPGSLERLIRFHRGGEFGSAEHVLFSGQYTFQVRADGWQLRPANGESER